MGEGGEVRAVADSSRQRKALRELPRQLEFVNKRASEEGWAWNGWQEPDYAEPCGLCGDFGLLQVLRQF